MSVELLGAAPNGRRLYLAQGTEPAEWHAIAGIGSFTLLLALDGNRHPDDEVLELARRLGRRGLGFRLHLVPGCERIHDLFDAAQAGEAETSRSVMTSWHDNESIEDTLQFAVRDSHPINDVPLDSVVAGADRPDWRSEIRMLLVELSRRCAMRAQSPRSRGLAAAKLEPPAPRQKKGGGSRGKPAVSPRLSAGAQLLADAGDRDGEAEAAAEDA